MKLVKFFIFFLFILLTILIILSICASAAIAASIGVSPAKIYLETVHDTLNQSIFIFNSNEEDMFFSLNSMNGFVSFSSSDGKIKKNSNQQIIVFINPTLDFSKGIYEDIILISAFKNKKSNFKNNIGVMAILNITHDINAVEYYFVDSGSLNNSNGSIELNKLINLDDNDKTKLSNLITGMSIAYNKNIKGSGLFNLCVVAVLIILLYLFVKEKNK
ncbi:MAG: hypothetical protein ABIG89_02155 [Candidatus Woesearchaeota archaeon]